MTKHGGITVVIPAFNRVDELKRCLDSIGSQSLRPERVIVVDDGSTDGTAEVARNHRVCPNVIRGGHRGANAARNVGLAAVETEWTMFFDSDDVMLPEHIEKVSGALSDTVDLIGWDITLRRLDGSKRTLPFEANDIAWHNIMHGTLATQRYLARTKLFRQAGGWDEALGVWQDIELGARLLELNPRIAKTPGNRVVQIQSADSITGTEWSRNTDRYAATFAALERTVGRRHPDWLRLKKAILAADVAREDAGAGKALLADTDASDWVVRAAYLYRRAGLRGVARVLRPFMS